MSTIKIENLSFSYHGYVKPIFENVSFSFETNWKIGSSSRGLPSLRRRERPRDRREQARPLRIAHCSSLPSASSRRARSPIPKTHTRNQLRLG